MRLFKNLSPIKYVFLISGIILMLIGGGWFISNLKLAISMQNTKASVVEYEELAGKKNTYSPKVEFNAKKFNSKEKNIHVITVVTNVYSKKIFKENEKVNIKYKKSDPNIARIVALKDSVALPIITLVIGFLSFFYAAKEEILNGNLFNGEYY